jgi:hypothetical protein
MGHYKVRKLIATAARNLSNIYILSEIGIKSVV